MHALRTWLGLLPLCLVLPATSHLKPARAAKPDESLVERAREAIARSEYEARPNARGLQAPNRANGLRTYFAPDGVSIRTRGGLDAPALLDLSLSRVGRPDRLAQVTPGEVTHDGARVEIRRPALTEWYVNSEAGLEEGFTVEKRPEGNGAFVLELRFANAAVAASGDGELLFQAASGRTLRFSALRAHDAQERALDARFELSGSDRVRLVVADTSAAYPITVDPLLTGTFDSTISDPGIVDLIGESVAWGDVNGDGYADAVISAAAYDAGPSATGAVFVFNGGPGGIPNGGPATANALLLNEGGQTQFTFGYSIATGDFNGDGYADVVVADHLKSFGAVYVFPGGPFGVQDGNPGSAQTVLTGTAGAQLGIKVACAGDVNGDGYDDLVASVDAFSPANGTAYVFLGGASGIPSGSVASAATVLTGTSAGFGGSVAAAGDVNGDGYDDLVIGDPIQSTAGDPNEGAAYIYLGSASGIASGSVTVASTTLVGSSPNLNLGWAVAAAGDVNGDGYDDLIVGAPEGAGRGAALIFEGTASGIASGAAFAVASSYLLSDANSAGFGSAVTAGDVNGDGYSDVAIGAPSYQGAAGAEGAAFVFLGGPSGIPTATTLASAYANVVAGSPAIAGLGYSVALGDVNGDGYQDLLVGAPSSGATHANEGTAYVSLGGPGGLVNGGISFANSTIESNQAGARLGYTVANAGDLNGDGFDDLAIGAPLYDLGQTDEGVVLVFNGSANGLPATLNPGNANSVIHGNAAQFNLGYAIAGAGDVNDDGYGDLLLGAPLLGSGQPGSALLYLGGPTGLPTLATPANASAVITSDVAGSEFGFSVAGIGDVNGDGFADIAVGGLYYGAGGAVFVFDGGLAGIGSGSTATASATLLGPAGSSFGTAVAAAGDVNGDGYSDLAVSAPSYTNGQTQEGAVFVYHGSASGIASGSVASANTTIESNQASAQLGGQQNSGVASAGDFNGDGYDDLLIGSPLYVGPGSNEGAVFLYRGGPSGIPSGSPTNANATFQGSQSNVNLGAAVASIGDVNGDGFADAAFGATGEAASPGGSPEGAVYVVLGNPTSNFVPSWTMLSGVTTGLQGLTTGPYFGFAIAGADVNGDGYSDLLVGAQTDSDPQNGEGAAFLFYGNQLDRGRAVRLRQRRTDTASAVVAPLGRAISLNGFSAEILGAHPSGSGRVAATFQACPRGTAFGGASCVSQTTPYALLGGTTPSTVLATTFSGLVANTLYHWRARLSYADDTGPIPPNPTHGPWRRPGARAALEDIRTGADTDGDGVPDAIDNCPLVANPSQADTGGMGPGSPPDKIGDACQCGSVAGDGHVDATDVAAYRAALANPTGAALSADAQTRCRVLGRTGACNIVQVTAIRRAIAAPSLLPIQSGPAAQFCVAALGS